MAHRRARGGESRRKVTTWEYEGGELHPYGERDRRMTIPVVMVTRRGAADDDDVPRDGRPTTRFEVELPEIDVHESDTDIDALRKRVFALVDERFRVAWRPMLRVTVQGGLPEYYDDQYDDDGRRRRAPDADATTTTPPRPWNGAVGSVSFEVRRVEVAEVQGQRYHRAYDDRGRNDGMRDGWPDEHQPEGRRGYDNATRALVPDTAEGRRAVDRIAQGLSELNRRLRALCAPAQAAASLSRLGAPAARPLLALDDGAAAAAVPTPEPRRGDGGAP